MTKDTARTGSGGSVSRRAGKAWLLAALALTTLLILLLATNRRARHQPATIAEHAPASSPAAPQVEAAPAAATERLAEAHVTTGYDRAVLSFGREAPAGLRVTFGHIHSRRWKVAAVATGARTLLLEPLPPGEECGVELSGGGLVWSGRFKTLEEVSCNAGRAMVVEPSARLGETMDLATDGDRLAVVWRDEETKSKHHLRFAESPDGGATWRPTTALAGPILHGLAPVLRLGQIRDFLLWLKGDRPDDGAEILTRSPGKGWARAWHGSTTLNVGCGLVEVDSDTIDALIPSLDPQGVSLLRFSGGSAVGEPERAFPTLGWRRGLAAIRQGGRIVAISREALAMKPKTVRLICSRQLSAGPARWSTPVVVTNGAEDPDEPRLAADGSGTLVLAYEDGQQVRCRVSRDGGVTWGAPTSPVNVEGGKSPSVIHWRGRFRFLCLSRGITMSFSNLRYASSVDGLRWDIDKPISLGLANTRQLKMIGTRDGLVAFLLNQAEGLVVARLDQVE